MLIKFAVGNYKSIRETISLSLVANGSDSSLPENIVSTNALKFSLVKQSAIYGPNAAGKSTILLALEALRSMVLNSFLGLQQDQAIPKIVPHRLDKSYEKEPTNFDVVFEVAGIRYQYLVVASAQRIMYECLTAWPVGSAQIWFEREWDEQSQTTNWKLGGKLEGSAQQKKLCQETTRDNALFLSTAVQLNNTQLKSIYAWFATGLIIIMPGKIDFNPHLSIEKLKKDHGQEELMSILSAADIGIERMLVEERNGLPTPPPGVPPELWIQQILGNLSADPSQLISTHLSSVHKRIDGSEVIFNFYEDESDGTKKLFEFAGGWLMALETGATLCIDEVDRSLHPVLVRMLVQLFASKMNSKNAQLIFTTHDTSLLDSNLLRRDQVWFVEKENQRATKLYSLLDYSPRKGENLERGYLLGRYGAIPFITEPDWVKHNG